MTSFRRWFRRERGSRTLRRRTRICPALEGLESRVVLYSATGSAWPNPQLITISFMPDGTNLGGGVKSNLFSTFNSKSNLAGKWENVIVQAAQAWAQQTNINFEVVPDDGAPAGSGADEQGDPGFGDIRIGGYNFDCSTLALTYQPPPANNFSIAGDMSFNTGQSFNINTTYDLYTVAMHEFGHALGLNESSVSNAVSTGPTLAGRPPWPATTSPDIRSIYGGTALGRCVQHGRCFQRNSEQRRIDHFAHQHVEPDGPGTEPRHLDRRTIGVLRVHGAVRNGKYARAGCPEQRSEPAGAEGDSLRIERLDRAGQRQRSGPVWHDAECERLQRHRGREILCAGAGGRYHADGHGRLCPGPQFQREHPARGGIDQSLRRPMAIRSTPVAARPMTRAASSTASPAPSSGDHAGQRRQQPGRHHERPEYLALRHRRHPTTSSRSTAMAM